MYSAEESASLGLRLCCKQRVEQFSVCMSCSSETMLPLQKALRTVPARADSFTQLHTTQSAIAALAIASQILTSLVSALQV